VKQNLSGPRAWWFTAAGSIMLIEPRINSLVQSARLHQQRGFDQDQAPDITNTTAQVVAFCTEPKSAKEIMTALGFKHWKTFQTNYLNPLLDDGILERTLPGKPQSPQQRYRLTQKGKNQSDCEGTNGRVIWHSQAVAMTALQNAMNDAFFRAAQCGKISTGK
jgi:hypothetical protein